MSAPHRRIAQTFILIEVAHRLVDSINGLVATGGISEQWVGLILLPIVGNAAEVSFASSVSSYSIVCRAV